MEKIQLNETPVRTAKNFNINNITLENIELPKKVNKFSNLKIINKSPKVIIKNNVEKVNLTYGLNSALTKLVEQNANEKFRIVIDGKIEKEIQINSTFDEKNKELVDNIQIVANKNAKATIIINYETNELEEAFHNGTIYVNAHENAELNIIITNLLNLKSNNFISIENSMETNAKVNYIIIDFGGKNSITNFYSNIKGDYAENNVSTIYLGKENQLFDLNYIGELRGKKSNMDIEVQGALKDNAKKHFKGTIDFKKGCKKATGNENEACMLLSDTAKSLSLPMLLCSEEDVEGNHSSSAGKIGEKALFYIMSRGFELKDAMKLMVRARFNAILEKIENAELRRKIIEKIEERLD